jgi:hypothetical protein
MTIFVANKESNPPEISAIALRWVLSFMGIACLLEKDGYFSSITA